MLLAMKAKDPVSKQWKFFIDKCLPFGAASSCNIFQCFSNALANITMFALECVKRKAITNYLDDFLKIAVKQWICDFMLNTFHEICDWLGVTLAKEKTVWGAQQVVFLGVLMDGLRCILSLPIEKRDKAINFLSWSMDKKKVTVLDIQRLTGLLNFITKAIVPGRVFTRRMYAKIQGKTANLKPHHHVSLDGKFRRDCSMWLYFLCSEDVSLFCRPFVDYDNTTSAAELGFFTDSSANEKLGFGGIFADKDWFFGQWEQGYIKRYKPSIAYLELYALVTGLFIFSERIRNLTLLVHCDNMSVVQMVNATSSACERCMHLLRMMVLRGLKYNFRVASVYINTKVNGEVDSLSRLQFDRFHKLNGYSRNTLPADLPTELWPASKIWKGSNRLECIA